MMQVHSKEKKIKEVYSISVAVEVIIRHNYVFSVSMSLIVGHNSTLKDKSGHKTLKRYNAHTVTFKSALGKLTDHLEGEVYCRVPELSKSLCLTSA